MTTCDYYNTLGIQAAMQNKAEEAIACFQQALTIDNKNMDALNNLGNMCLKNREFSKALHFYETAIEYYPNFSMAYNNIGSTLKKLHKPYSALPFFQKAVSLDATNILALNNFAHLCKHVNKFDEAETHFALVLKFEPNNLRALGGLGEINLQRALAYSRTHNDKIIFFTAAKQYFTQALQLDKNHHDAHRGMALLLAKFSENNQDNIAAIIDHYEKAFNEEEPSLMVLGNLLQYYLEAGNWEQFAVLKEKILQLYQQNKEAEPITPFHVMMAYEEPIIQKTFTEHWANFTSQNTEFTFKHHYKKNINKKKIRIGYISSDLSEHPVGFLINELFLKHNRNEFEVYGFPTRTYEYSALYNKIINTFDVVVELSPYSHNEAAHKIHAAQIDILIDLTGH